MTEVILENQYLYYRSYLFRIGKSFSILLPGTEFLFGKKYGDAENYYIKSLENGFDRGTASYALGLNAYAKGDMDKAYKYLSDASRIFTGTVR